MKIFRGGPTVNGNIDWARLGYRIADLRRARKLTQEQLAEKTGLSFVYIGYIEQGKRHASLETYIRIANALEYTLDDLAGDFLAADDSRRKTADLNVLASDCTDEQRDALYRVIMEMIRLIRSR